MLGHEHDIRKRIRRHAECGVGLHYRFYPRAHHHAGYSHELCGYRFPHLCVGVGDGIQIYPRHWQEAYLQSGGIRRRALGAYHQPVGHLVGRRQFAAPPLRASRRIAHRAQDTPRRPRACFLGRRASHCRCDERHGSNQRHSADSLALLILFPRARDAYRAPHDASQPFPAASVRRHCRFPFCTEHSPRLLLFHAGTRAPYRQHLCLFREPKRAVHAHSC